ncbi:MAG: phosphodiesterase [Fibrobacter sp.]|nr:phosphodiesterase [Fibrobacter sp.]
MRALILSDIHGSAIAARQALSFFEKFNCDKIFLLGDTLYHGPRNPLPAGHGPMGVVDALAPYKGCITAVRGNCDADVDLMMLDMPIEDEYAVVKDAAAEGAPEKTLFLSHGHIFMPECFPADALHAINPNDLDANSTQIDAYLYGHTHIWKLEKNFKGVLLVNPGSTSLPKGGNPPTFALYESATSSSPARFSIHRLVDGSELAAAEI